MTNFNIQIISDSVCPWCYVGFRRLSRAIKIHQSTNPTDTFTITWSPFYLNPSSPSYPGVDKTAFYQTKFGPERTSSIFSRLTAIGKAEGIAFQFGGRTGRTRDSHRLAWFAGLKEKELSSTATDAKPDSVAGGSVIGGLQTRVIENLFRAYFEEEKNITDHQVLLEAALKAGLDRGEVESLLTSTDGAEEVDAEAEKAREHLVTGVPYFTIQDKYIVEGADEPEAFLNIFDQVKADSA